MRLYADCRVNGTTCKSEYILHYNGIMPVDDEPLQTPLLSALAKWPNVPDCFGWLSLDPRGRWRIQGKTITHQRTIAFINRNYSADEIGRWSFQNGPQRVFVDLEYTPWVYRLEHGDQLWTHTGSTGGLFKRLLIDKAGTLIADAETGVGILHDSDLQSALDKICNPDGTRPSDGQLETEFARLYETGETELHFRWGAELLQIEAIDSQKLAARFRYIPRPR